jgi:acetyltransferase-like isoleucine patch superfamily enzyme
MGYEQSAKHANDCIKAENEQRKAALKNISKCSMGEGCDIRPFTDLYGCRIGKNVKIDSFTYIEEGATIGDDCRIRTHVFIPTGVNIGNRVFIASGVRFTNDRYPRIGVKNPIENTFVEDDVTIGSGATILPVRIGKGSLIGAGAVITDDVPPNSIIITEKKTIRRERLVI